MSQQLIDLINAIQAATVIDQQVESNINTLNKMLTKKKVIITCRSCVINSIMLANENEDGEIDNTVMELMLWDNTDNNYYRIKTCDIKNTIKVYTQLTL